MDAEQSGWDRPLLSDLPMEVALEDTVLGTLNGLAFSAGLPLGSERPQPDSGAAILSGRRTLPTRWGT